MTTTVIPSFGVPFILEELANDIREGKIQVVFTTVDTGEGTTVRTLTLSYRLKADLGEWQC
jgi:hypothetical protein